MSLRARCTELAHTFTTPPLTRKRKAIDCVDSVEGISNKANKTVNAALPATPLTNASTTPIMDSDDEFMSGASSLEEDFGGTQDSENESLGDGEISPPRLSGAEESDCAIDFEDDEPDMGFSQDKDIIKPTKKPYEVDFQVYSPADIQAHQDRQIDELSAILGQPPESSAILLRHARWNKERLIEAYMDRPEEVLDRAGLGQDYIGQLKTEVVPGFACCICCEDEPGLETYAMKCGHRFCVDCYRQYLAQKIKDEGEAARIQCPEEGCSRIVDSKSLDLLVAADVKKRYGTCFAMCWQELIGNVQVRGAADSNVRRRQGEFEVVPGSELRVRH